MICVRCRRPDRVWITGDGRAWCGGCLRWVAALATVGHDRIARRLRDIAEGRL